MLSLLYCPTITTVHDYWKNHSFDFMDLCQQRDDSAFWNTTYICYISQMALAIKNLHVSAGGIRDTGSISWSRRSPGEGHGNSFQYSCLEKPTGQKSLVGYSSESHSVRHDWSIASNEKNVLIPWLQPTSSVIFGSEKNKICSLFPYLFAMRWINQMSWSLFFESWFHPHQEAL